MGDDGIVSDRIRAAGAVYVAAMFDAMKAFDVADRLVELFLAGQLPLTRSPASSLLYEYWRDARERMTANERRGLYAQTFGIPTGDAVDVEPNREFNALWLRFLATVSEFERQQAVGEAVISKQDVQTRARELAANVSRHGAHAAAAAIA